MPGQDTHYGDIANTDPSMFLYPTVTPYIPPTLPYRCPVCQGRGSVPIGFYNYDGGGMSTSTTPEICRACGGRGIVWG